MLTHDPVPCGVSGVARRICTPGEAQQVALAESRHPRHHTAPVGEDAAAHVVGVSTLPDACTWYARASAYSHHAKGLPPRPTPWTVSVDGISAGPRPLRGDFRDHEAVHALPLHGKEGT